MGDALAVVSALNTTGTGRKLTIALWIPTECRPVRADFQIAMTSNNIPAGIESTLILGVATNGSSIVARFDIRLADTFTILHVRTLQLTFQIARPNLFSPTLIDADERKFLFLFAFAELSALFLVLGERLARNLFRFLVFQTDHDSLLSFVVKSLSLHIQI